MKTQYPLLVLVILFLLASGCVPEPTPTPEAGQLILDSPCSPPCWYHIIPGKTTEEEVPGLLEQIPALDQERSTKIGPWSVYSGIYVIDFHGNYQSGEIKIKDGLVNRITLVGDFNLSLEKTIDGFGPPDQIVSTIRMTGDVQTKSLYLLYPEAGLVIRVDQSGFKPITVEKADRVDAVYFVNPQTFFDLLTQSPEIFYPSELAEQSSPWPGWGTVLEK